MKIRLVITIFLLIVVTMSAVYLIAEESRGKRGTASASDVSDPQDTLAGDDGKVRSDVKNPDRKIVAYYFHGNFRCATCRKIEAYAEEAIRTEFPDELENGELEWKVVNVEEPENRHFEKEYELYTRSLVLVEIEDGTQKKWDNLEKVWELVRDKKAFTKYVVENTRAYLVGGDD